MAHPAEPTTQGEAIALLVKRQQREAAQLVNAHPCSCSLPIPAPEAPAWCLGCGGRTTTTQPEWVRRQAAHELRATHYAR